VTKAFCFPFNYKPPSGSKRTKQFYTLDHELLGLMIFAWLNTQYDERTIRSRTRLLHWCLCVCLFSFCVHACVRACVNYVNVHTLTHDTSYILNYQLELMITHHSCIFTKAMLRYNKNTLLLLAQMTHNEAKCHH